MSRPTEDQPTNPTIVAGQTEPTEAPLSADVLAPHGSAPPVPPDPEPPPTVGTGTALAIISIGLVVVVIVIAGIVALFT